MADRVTAARFCCGSHVKFARSGVQRELCQSAEPVSSANALRLRYQAKCGTTIPTNRPHEDRAAILEEMEYVRKNGTSVARHLRKDIYEVRTTYNTKAYRILFACEGRFHHVLLALEGFQKKTQHTPKAHMNVAEQRLATARESKASTSGE